MDRLVCPFEGCDKSFQRKEHLARHERGHNPDAVCACNVCHKRFKRSDTLRRHFAQHGPALASSSLTRIKKACLSCHTGKRKCDGGQPCSFCHKKGLGCEYRSRRDDSQASESNTDPANRQSDLAKSVSSSLAESNVLIDLQGPITPDGHTSVGFSSHEETPHARQINWLSIQVIRDLPPFEINHRASIEALQDARYLERCFKSFHTRWPIIHWRSQVPVDGEQYSEILIPSLRMIGAWFEGGQGPKALAMKLHHRTVNSILPRLLNVTFEDQFDRSLSVGLCQVALINIIFIIYCGNRSLLSQASTMVAVLVTALRKVGLFNRETAWIDEKRSYFPPMQMVKLGYRQRIVAFLFRADVYLSLLLDQPTSINIEDLHFSVPSSFALWNTMGLHVWEERQAAEILHRDESSMIGIIKGSYNDARDELSHPWLIEDIHLCLCAMRVSIWNLSKSTITFMDSQPEVFRKRGQLKSQLAYLKGKLDQISSQKQNERSFGNEDVMPLRQYFALEDHTQLAGQDAIKERVRLLIFDAYMLYQLLALHLHANIPTFTLLAESQRQSPIQQASQMFQQTLERREAMVSNWVNSPTARQMLCHVADILRQHQERFGNGPTGGILHNDTPDPISLITISTAALILWTYCKFCDPCDACNPNPQSNIGPMIKLINSTLPSVAQEHIRRAWIERGGKFRVQIQGIQLCGCNLEFLMAIFKTRLPNDWELADIIAPGVFRSSSSTHHS